LTRDQDDLLFTAAFDGIEQGLGDVNGGFRVDLHDVFGAHAPVGHARIVNQHIDANMCHVCGERRDLIGTADVELV
jgi:hypothetical protein